MTGIRKPRTPRGENKLTTIALQDKQIKQLIDRMQEVAKRCDETQLTCNRYSDRIIELNAELDLANNVLKGKDRRIEDFRESHSRMLGYQDCAREIFERIIKK